MMKRQSAFLLGIILSFGWTSYAAEICAQHDGLPVYCYDTVRSYFEIDNWHVSQYSDNIPNVFFPSPMNDCLMGFNCQPSRVWFNGPDIPAPTKSDVSVKFEFDAYAVCAITENDCANIRPSTDVVRFELLADNQVIESYVVNGSNSVLMPFGTIWKFSTPVSMKILGSTVNAGQKVSLRVTPLAPALMTSSGTSAITLKNVTVNFTAIP